MDRNYVGDGYNQFGELCNMLLGNFLKIDQNLRDRYSIAEGKSKVVSINKTD